jgi:hypothetical protein
MTSKLKVFTILAAGILILIGCEQEKEQVFQSLRNRVTSLVNFLFSSMNRK